MSNFRPKQLFLIFVVVAILALAFGVVIKKTFVSKSKSSKIQIVTSLFPLYDFAKNIGQDKVEVRLLLPFGTEAHSFDPTPNDMININQSDIFIYTGPNMEPWVNNLLSGLTNKKLIVVNASQHLNLIPGVFHDADEPAGSMDPHVWLDFADDQIIIDDITAALIQKDPNNKSFYESNSQNYKQQLINLDQQYSSSLSTCQNREFIYGGHYTFGYLAARYHLNYASAQGISPDSEPTAGDLASLVNQVRKNNVKYIFYEELSSPKIADTLATETGAKLLSLSSAHNISKDQFNNNISFISILKEDLINLKTGLNCQ